MAKESKESKKIKFKYIFDNDYNPIFVNGAMGGITPSGEISVNFYFERHPIPYSVTHDLNPDNTLSDESEIEPQDLNQMYVRVIKNGIILDLEKAKRIHKWLGDQIKSLEEINKNIESAKSKSENIKNDNNSSTDRGKKRKR